MSERLTRGTCPICHGRAAIIHFPWEGERGARPARIGAHRTVGLGGHGGRCTGSGEPPVPGTVR